MDRPDRPFDRAKVRAAVRRLEKEYAYLMLEDAIELLPHAALAQLFGPYIDVTTLRADDRDAPEASLRASVEAFARASLAGEYYEPFDVDSRNSTQRCSASPSRRRRDGGFGERIPALRIPGHRPAPHG